LATVEIISMTKENSPQKIVQEILITSQIAEAEDAATVPYIYVGTADGNIHKLNTDGSTVSGWNSSSGVSGKPQGSFAIDHFSAGVNAVWFGTDNGKTYRVSNVDGSVTSSYASAATAVRTSPYLAAGYGDASRNTHNIYFGDDDGWRDNLDRLVDDLVTEADLSPLGVEIAAADVIVPLRNRLQITAWRKEHPEIADERIATTVEDLMPFLEEKGHPALTMDPLL